MGAGELHDAAAGTQEAEGKEQRSEVRDQRSEFRCALPSAISDLWFL